MNALFDLGDHIHCLEDFLLHRTRDKHSDENIRRAFWRPIESCPDDQSMNPNWIPGALEESARTASCLLGTLPEWAMEGAVAKVPGLNFFERSKTHLPR